jgi:hypothetical protein
VKLHHQFYWSKNNAKLRKTAEAWTDRFGTDVRIVSFNIPQLQSETGKKTCPYAGICAEVCYAAQGHMGMPAASAAYERNFTKVMKIGRSRKLSNLLCEDIGSMRRITHIRLHDSGDFFARWYYEAWLEVAERNPEITFYAYTKSIPFLDWESHPSNLRVVQSMGGKRDKDIDDSKPHSRIFVDAHERSIAGYCDGNQSDLPAILGRRKIGLVYHGTRHLTSGEKTRLSIL